MKSFTISKVGWHTSTIGNTEPREKTIRRTFVFANFLQQNGLTVRRLVESEGEIDDDFTIRSDDLTEEGMTVVKLAYDKWLRKVDRGMDPSNIAVLERALKKVRSLN